MCVRASRWLASAKKSSEETNKAMYSRRSPRLRDFDYRQDGVYFVTIATYRMAQLFGQVVAGQVILTDLGILVDAEWRKTAEVRPSVDVDHYVVMPNHIHGILFISESQHAVLSTGKTTLSANSLGSIVAQFKSVVTKRSRQLAYPPRSPIWKRNYYDHIVRNEQDLDRIRRYIIANPARWSEDEFFAK